MPLGKCTVIAIGVLCSVYLNGIQANGIGEKDLGTSLRDLNFKSYVLSQEIDSADLNDTGVDVRQHAGCNCENGKCVRDGNRELCVCDPQFARFEDSRCTYCDCGIGFNCTFRRNYWGYPRYSKDCDCPAGYEDTDGRCREKCSPSKGCQNGGFCTYSGKCQCPTGTYGDFCEAIDGCLTNCRPRKIVDCQYSKQNEQYACVCKNRSLVYDYMDRLCKPCPCGEHGRCVFERRTLRCECDSGFQEYNGYCKLCACGPGSYACSFLYDGVKSCLCHTGYVNREGYCVECGCGFDGITCNLENGVKKCACPAGYEDRFGICEDIDECRQTDACAPTAKCVNTEGSYRCECEEGYTEINGDIKEGCKDIDECRGSHRCSWWDRTQCVNLPGTYKCVCETGYQPVDMTVEPSKTKCEEYQKSWLPSILTFCTAGFMIITAVGANRYVAHRINIRSR